jgi:tRNA 2-selenouridine synthase SelU
MKSCDAIVLIKEEMEHHVNVLVEDYILDLGWCFVPLYGDELGPDLHRNFFLDGLKQICNRLGRSGYKQMACTMTAAFRREQEARPNTSLHRVWITALLEMYYDKMYQSQLTQRC